MARHSASNRANKIKRNVAVSASVALTAAPFAFFQAPGYAADAETCEAINDGVSNTALAVAEYVDNAVCQLIFTDVTQQPITIPAGVSKISVFAVGGGAGSFEDSGTYGGSGGQVVVIDDLESGAEIPAGGRTYTLQAGSGSLHSGSGSNAGSASTILLGGVTKLSASGGLQNGSSKPALLNGTPLAGTNYSSDWGSDESAGAGTAGNFVSSTVGGPGYSIGEAITANALDSTLWGAADGSGTPGDGNELSEFSIQYSYEMGQGGNRAADTVTTMGTLGYGAGGSTNSDASSALNGEDGVIILRFALAPSKTVSFSPNGAAGTMSSQSESSATSLSAVGFTRDGFTFSGWATAPDGTGTTYSDGASYDFAADTTLYAQWTASSQLLTCDINQGALEFNRAVESGALTTEIAQAEGDSSNDIGTPGSANDYFHYFDISTACGTQIDARVTVTTVENLAGLDEVDRASSSTGKNPWINTGIESNTAADSYVELQIEFLTGLTYEAGSGTPVTLQDFAVSTYDIDDYQYLESNEFDRYYLSTPTNTILKAVATTNGFTRIAELNGESTSSDTDQQTKSRATLEYDAADTVTIRLGQVPLNSDETASYYVDFSPGLDWSGVKGESVVNPSSTPGTPAAPVSVPYEGPISIRQTSSGTCVGDLATITGSRLGTIENIYVDGTDIPFTLVSDSKINFNIPNMKAGSYQLKYWVPVNNVNLTDKITIGSCSVAVTEPDPDVTDDETTETEVGSGELTPFYVAKRFTSYRGDRGAIVAADREAITAFIAANPGLTHITCVGSTSGRPASPTDKALAMARAENACSVVENLVPGITTRMVTSTGRGVGQFYRAVTLFGKGLKEN